MASKIEWLDGGDTWNPIRARNKTTGGVGHWCVHVSPGCEHCYSEAMQRRFKNNIRFAAQDQAKIDIFLDEGVLTKPMRWRKPRLIFPCSMTDLFGEWVTDEQLDRIFAVMALAPQHTFQVLTKRAARMRKYVTEVGQDLERLNYAAMDLIDYDKPCEDQWPMRHVWLGVSVEDQRRADERIPDLLETPAAVRWLSVEPMLGAVDLNKWPSDPEVLDWVVCGGESGPNARPFDLAWARSLRDQCKAAGVPYFLKQLGAKPIGMWGDDTYPRRRVYKRDALHTGPPPDRWPLEDRKGGDIAEFPADLRVREYPKSHQVTTIAESNQTANLGV